MPAFELVVPAIRGVQAGREFYVSMFPLRHVPHILRFHDEELKPELRAQRMINKQRVPEIARYILKNLTEYTFSSLTASIDGIVQFEPSGDDDTRRNVGRLRIPMDARILINDGQHRRAAIEAALEENPDIGDETISVVLFLDVGLKRCQQMFADLNRYPIRPTPSLSILYDHRDEASQLAKGVVCSVPFFADLTETEKSTISNRSTKLFTLSGIHNATQALLTGLALPLLEDKIRLAAEFWTEVGKHISDWQMAIDRKISPADLRRDYVHAHTLALAAIARAGNQLLTSHPRNWKAKLKKLSTLDWSRSNSKQWEGRAMNAGRLSKRNVNVTLTGNLVKQHLELSLSPDEQELERQFRRTRNGRTANH
jgi:DNA sulfur modification protein DndB